MNLNCFAAAQAGKSQESSYMQPHTIEQWFPIEQQRKYVNLLQGRIGITRRRAEYFVKLWAYLLLKQQQELGKRLQQPLTELDLPVGFIPCTHREAQEVFYGEQERGSDRSAGMMLDKLVALGLIEKDFDGSTTCIRIRSLISNQQDSTLPPDEIQLIPDYFNPRTDAIPVATFLARNYNWMNKKATALPHRIARIIRGWAEQYPKGMRVLRRSDTQDAVGFYVLYPVAPESEANFFIPPRHSLHLSATWEHDPFQIANIGDRNCTSVFVRSWQIDLPYKQLNTASEFLQDVQKAFVRMQADFPELCDIYCLAIHPNDEELLSSLGFQKTNSDSQIYLHWMYLPLDKYLSLDIDQAISKLKFD
ncbi:MULTISPECIES: hypothetical protein [unclassified Tolypothrix]|uniref:hypothetical protein n=1 Tax=unclassified Tolypothrix TaxID=2649714 RepID=UPI0005EAAF6C|nr:MULTISPECIES: hypothetical protein [unclassified Tolypothrix]EKF05960.1 hypothetical protein FDUTEX481_00311 [Tolypothrix sp. PCC 7601]